MGFGGLAISGVFVLNGFNKDIIHGRNDFIK
jgi:hypothetical protein